MTNDEVFKLIGILLVSFFIIYFSIKLFQLQSNLVEGMTTGETSNAASNAAALKSQVIKMQDELLVSKYRKDYETSIINLDDYVGYLMLKQIVNLKIDGNVKSVTEGLNNLNILKEAKDSLNTAMTFLDKQ